MKPYDPKTAARVWDRVQNAAVLPADAQGILHLVAEAQLDYLTYQRLAKHLPQHAAATARSLANQEQSHVVCLKGIYTLITGEKASVPTPALSDDPPQIVLRRCYGRQMRCLSQYEARMDDPQYGHVFRRLAIQEQEHCQKILELLGTLNR